MSLKFRFVTSGQAQDDAAIFTQTLNGVSLKPLAPVNVRGYQDIITHNVCIEWNRRARIGGGLRPLSDVPLAEEADRYEVDIMNGSTVLRTISVRSDDDEPPIWELMHSQQDTLLLSYADDGGLVFIDGGSNIVLLSKQVFHADSENVSVSLIPNIDETIPHYVGLFPISSLTGVPTSWIPAVGFQTDFINTTTVGITPAVILATSATVPKRMTIRVVRGQATLYEEPNFNSPLGSATVTLAGSYRLLASNTGNQATIVKPRVSRSNTPSVVYLLADQLTDFGSLQSSITVRVYQISSIIGRGAYTQATISLS